MKKRMPLIIIAAGVALILGVYFGRGVFRRSEERRVRALVAAACDALAREDVDALTVMLHADFVFDLESDQHYARHQIDGILNWLFRTFGGVDVRPERPVKVEVLTTYATARLHTRTTSPLNPGRRAEHYWRLEFRKTDERWLFTRVEQIEQDYY